MVLDFLHHLPSRPRQIYAMSTVIEEEFLNEVTIVVQVAVKNLSQQILISFACRVRHPYYKQKTKN